MSQQNICRGVHTAVVNDVTGFEVIYRGTRVVSKTLDDDIVLNTGGWKTATTKTRMNQAANEFELGYQVFQKNHEWFVTWRGETLPFIGDSITLYKG